MPQKTKRRKDRQQEGTMALPASVGVSQSHRSYQAKLVYSTMFIIILLTFIIFYQSWMSLMDDKMLKSLFIICMYLKMKWPKMSKSTRFVDFVNHTAFLSYQPTTPSHSLLYFIVPQPRNLSNGCLAATWPVKPVDQSLHKPLETWLLWPLLIFKVQRL